MSLTELGGRVYEWMQLDVEREAAEVLRDALRALAEHFETGTPMPAAVRERAERLHEVLDRLDASLDDKR